MANIRDLSTRMRGRRVRGPVAGSGPRPHWRGKSDPVWNRARRGRSRITSSDLRLVLLAGALAGLALAGVGEPWTASRLRDAAPTSFVEAGDADWARDVRVIDGDTFWTGGVKVRIADIDTPELSALCPREAALAERARVRLTGLLAAGPFDLETVGSRDEDRYGRKLRVVTREGRSLGDQLVAEGLARTWVGRREPWC